MRHYRHIKNGLSNAGDLRASSSADPTPSVLFGGSDVVTVDLVQASTSAAVDVGHILGKIILLSDNTGSMESFGNSHGAASQEVRHDEDGKCSNNDNNSDKEIHLPVDLQDEEEITNSN